MTLRDANPRIATVALIAAGLWLACPTRSPNAVDERVRAGWARNRAIMSDLVNGRPVDGDKVDAAGHFFERLTRITVRVDWNSLGSFPTMETEKSLKTIDEWYTRNSAGLWWEATTKRVVLCRDSGS